MRFNKAVAPTGWRALVVAGALALSTCSQVIATAGPKPLPQRCQTECVTPYGEDLGATNDGVVAYSNCKAGCFVFAPNKLNGTYTGIQWQCVEFARRWLLVNKGMVYGDVEIAADIWNKIDFYTRVNDEVKIPITNFSNGSATIPQSGDLLIYAKEFLGTGHVAVITAVDRAAHKLYVAEQNFKNSRWPGHFARVIEYENRDNGTWVKDEYLIGWKRAMETMH